MKKGVNLGEVYLLIDKGMRLGLDLCSVEMKDYVHNGYNELYGSTSRSTIMSNLREDALVFFQEDMFISKLPQDNNKVDLIAAKLDGGRVSIIISQQKGNNASFNSTTLQKTLEKLGHVRLVDHVKYFGFLPDELNPTKNGLEYDLEVIIGFTTAYSEKVESFRSGSVVVDYYCGDMYLRKFGISSKKMSHLDLWVSKQDKVCNHNYDAISECYNFLQVFDECIEAMKEFEF